MTLVNVPLHPHKIKAATATKIDSYKCFKICTLMLSGNCDFFYLLDGLLSSPALCTQLCFS